MSLKIVDLGIDFTDVKYDEKKPLDLKALVFICAVNPSHFPIIVYASGSQTVRRAS